MKLNLDFCRQCGAQQARPFGDHGLQPQDLPVLILPAAECQNLPDECGGAVAGILHVDYRAHDALIRGQFRANNSQVAAQHRQDVVEVVRDPAGQRSEGIEFLCLALL